MGISEVALAGVLAGRQGRRVIPVVATSASLLGTL